MSNAASKFKKTGELAMKNIQRFTTTKKMALVTSLLLPLVIASNASAKTPFTAAEAADQKNILMTAVKQGDDLWHSPKLGSNGLACGNCHPDGSASNPHTWPKYQSNLGKVSTLRDMINWCIAVPLAGKPLAMEAYATYTHRGVAIAPGKDEQHGAVPVISGPGYPNANTGNR